MQETQRRPGGREHQHMAGPDLSACATEPIHIPGRIQPHGVLLAVREPDLEIVQVSANVDTFLGCASERLLGFSLGMVLDETAVEAVRHALSLPDLTLLNPMHMRVRSGATAREMDGVLHRTVDGVVVLELEPSAAHAPASFATFYHTVKGSTARIRQTADIAEMAQIAADEVRGLTGFDRVMVYQFDANWNGDVLAEAKREDLEPYLGLHYPADDIPAQARELYRKNWLRAVVDVFAQPAPLVPIETPQTGKPLDLSYSVLRSVSPVHIEYLKNMGVGASMSVSILREGQLWGLISCHHDTARHVPYETRMACEFLAQVLSAQVTALLAEADRAQSERLREMGDRLREYLAEQTNSFDALEAHGPELLALVKAHGAALCVENDARLIGTTPTVTEVLALRDWLGQESPGTLYVSDRLPEEYPPAEAFKAAASGLLAVSISRTQRHYMLWFRPEFAQTVTWGGNPHEHQFTEIEDGIPRLHPRRSFEAWQETVQLRSRPWEPLEVLAARDLQTAVTSFALQRTVAELARSNEELDAFTYSVSHDLKEPLRGVYTYSGILLEDYAGKLEEDAEARLRTLVRLSQRMEGQLDSLLEYSRVGRVDLAVKMTDLDVVLREQLELLHPRIEELGVEIRVPRPLPRVRCDQARVGEIFANLISNAMKYNDKPEKWVEIGYWLPDEATASGEASAISLADGTTGTDDAIVVYVRDNGIGIASKQYDTIFRIFKRLHARGKFGGGTGAGLTIVKRIVERHGGTIWVESKMGEGTTFAFTLQK